MNRRGFPEGLGGWLPDLGGLIIFTAVVWLAARSRAAIGIWEFLLVMLIMWAVLLATYAVCPQGLSRSSGRSIWLWAILFRLAGAFAEPMFEDDWYRYLWDGRTFIVEGNPYGHAPAEYFTRSDLPQQFERILDNINYPDVPTIYGPLCQYVFAAAYLIAPGALWPLKLLLLLGDLLVVFCLFRMTTPRNALLYAWCPLAITESAFNAHPEVLGVAGAVLAFCALQRGRATASLIGIGLSLAARIHAVLLLPFVLARVAPRRWWLLAASITLLYLPFWLQGSVADWTGLRAFLRDWEFNSTVFAAVATVLGTVRAKFVCGATFAIVYGLFLSRWYHGAYKNTAIPRGDWIYGVFFLLSAVVNPWYMLWLLPFVALFPSIAGIVACVVVSLSYVHGLNLNDAGLAPYEHPWWVRPAEIGAVCLAFAADWFRRSRAKRETG